MNTKINISRIAVLYLILGSNYHSHAQHCPFDGTSIILVKVFDQQNHPVKKSNTRFILKEINNLQADSCTYAPGILQQHFKPVDSIYAAMPWIKTYENKMKKSFILKGDFFVLLNMAQTDCMKRNGNDFTFLKRKFTIIFKGKNQDSNQAVPVPEDKIYSLCTNGSWDRITAINIYTR